MPMVLSVVAPHVVVGAGRALIAVALVRMP
jgi:hypothetical protein